MHHNSSPLIYRQNMTVCVFICMCVCVCVLVHVCVPHLEDVVGTLAAEVVLARQDDHGLAEHLQADGTDQLLLQTLHDAESPRTPWVEAPPGHRLKDGGRRGQRTCPAE